MWEKGMNWKSVLKKVGVSVRKRDELEISVKESGSECERKQKIGGQCETQNVRLIVGVKERARNWWSI